MLTLSNQFQKINNDILILSREYHKSFKLNFFQHYFFLILSFSNFFETVSDIFKLIIDFFGIVNSETEKQKKNQI